MKGSRLREQLSRKLEKTKSLTTFAVRKREKLRERQRRLPSFVKRLMKNTSRKSALLRKS